MSTQIKYNGSDPFAGISNVPLVSRQISYVMAGERLCAVDSITLNGVLTGACIGFSGYELSQRKLISGFKNDFKVFEIVEDSGVIYSRPYSVVKGITFGQSAYVGLIPYTINIECHPEEYYSDDGYFGVLQPSNQINFDEGLDGTVTITRTISAKGVNTNDTNNNALQNAKNFVYSLTGSSIGVLPNFIAGYGNVTPCLKSVSEQVNRMTAEHSFVEVYRGDLLAPSSGITRFSTTYSSGIQDGFSNVSIKGSIEGCKGMPLSVMRSVYQGMDIYGMAVKSYQSITSLTDLNPDYLASGVSENSNIPSLEFSVDFNNDLAPAIYVEYDTKLDTDYLTDISTYSYDAKIKSRGPLKLRWARVSGYASTFDVLSNAITGYNNYGLAYPINPYPISSGSSSNSFLGEVSFSLSLNNKNVPPSGLRKFEYNVDVTPAINKYSMQPLLVYSPSGSGYAVFDLNYSNREVMSINGTAITNDDTDVAAGVAIVRSQLNSLRAGYLSSGIRSGIRLTILDSRNISTGLYGRSKSISFKASWSYENGPLAI